MGLGFEYDNVIDVEDNSDEQAPTILDAAIF